jgi:hypothetical protein
MSDPQPQPQPQPVTVLCSECGTLIEVKDPQALVRTLHLMNECPTGTILAPQA